MLNKTLSAMILVGCLLLPAGKTRAQTTLDTGALRGRITDEKGIAIPGAIIRACGEHGGKVGDSDVIGGFGIGFLKPGAYEVTISGEGFQKQILKDVQILKESFTSVEVAMKLSETSDSSEKSEIVIATKSQSGGGCAGGINLTEAIKEYQRDHPSYSLEPLTPISIGLCSRFDSSCSYPVVPVTTEKGFIVSREAMERFGWRSLQDIF